MKLRKLILLIVMIIPLGAVEVARTNEALSDWEIVGTDGGTGIEYQQFRLTNPAPVNIFVARMERTNRNVTIESSIAQGRLSGGGETVSGMAERYDQALNFWGEPTIPVSQTWGSRNDVIVAINGFYYGSPWEDPGVPWSGQIYSGWYAKRYSDLESLSGFVWKMDRSAFIGECITHPIDKQVAYIQNGGDQLIQEIDGLNISHSDDDLILYTPQYDSETGTCNECIEVLIEMEIPTSISVAGDMPHGIIREVWENHGSNPIQFDHVILSAQGTAATILRSYVNVGNEVAIAQRVKDCLSNPEHDWTYAYSGVGGQFYFLRDGTIFDYSEDGQANVRDPRTAIAYNNEYIFFIVADGRDPGESEGMKVGEMAEFAKNTLGATNGIMQDGGGSSTMVINGNVVNNTFCNNVYCTDKVFLPLIINTSDSKDDSSNQSSVSEPFMELVTEAQALQRLVANGMMMVVVEPLEKSEEYSLGKMVATTTNTNLHLGPGTNYGILTPLQLNAIGEVTNHTNGLDGVFVKGSFWWRVNFGNDIGWVSETDIAPTLKYRSSNEFKPH